jgi:hypothetical protein
MKNLTGSPVEGNNFFGREKEIEYVWKSILDGNNIILSAPRRVGKTSFAKKMIEVAQKLKWNTIEINLEEVTSEEKLISLFLENLQTQNWFSVAKDEIKDMAKSIKFSGKFMGAEVNYEYQQEKENNYNKLKKLLNHKVPTLIMIDELSVLLTHLIKKDEINGKVNVEALLNWFRSLRQVSGSKIRWIFCSSVGIENFTHQYKLSYSINDISSFPLDVFSHEKASEMVKALAKTEHLSIDNQLIDFFLQKLGWFLPYFIQILFKKVHELHKVYNYELNSQTIDHAYDLLLQEKHLNTWDERLKDYFEMEEYLRSILKMISKNPNGEKRENIKTLIYNQINDEPKTDLIVSEALLILTRDGYLMEKERIYNFRSPLLRDFWCNRFIK